MAQGILSPRSAADFCGEPGQVPSPDWASAFLSGKDGLCEKPMISPGTIGFTILDSTLSSDPTHHRAKQACRNLTHFTARTLRPGEEQ